MGAAEAEKGTCDAAVAAHREMSAAALTTMQTDIDDAIARTSALATDEKRLNTELALVVAANNSNSTRQQALATLKRVKER